ncbi:MAG: ABC transporter substrate-binding protein [Chloroflexi bacterium]|nr:ABC transporter substrate-binding protein [Chloroflexota bacterium]
MRRRIIWILVTFLVVISLILAACAPTAQKTTTPTVPTTLTPTVKPAAPPAEKPKYGGTFNRALNATDILFFDDVVGLPYLAYTHMITNESLFSGDWTKGPASGYGANVTSWDWPNDRWELKAGYIAESWNSDVGPETNTVTWHIRKGVRWALNPNSEASKLVGGREVTSDDVVFSLKQVITDPRAFVYKSNPELRGAKITAPDKYTVKIEVPSTTFAAAVSRFGDATEIVPPEVVTKFGAMTDWKNSVGTGPFMLTEFVKGSVATLERNPNHWMKNPLGPGKGDQLPYLDRVKLLLIPDRSTLYAALRTARVDWYSGISIEDAAKLRETTPQLMSAKINPTTVVTPFYMKTDTTPFNDIRVRRALMMATDFESVKNKLYGGDAQILAWPITFTKEYAAAYLGLDVPEMPASVKELYTYNPEKAKALLKEAGYPNGFKTNIVYQNLTDITDYLSIVKDMWAKVGVDLALDPKEAGAYEGMFQSKSYDQLYAGHGYPMSILYNMNVMRGPSGDNASNINDPIVEQYYPKVQKAAGSGNFAEADRLYKELMKYVLDQAWVIPRVNPSTYTMWWPWLKNYKGEVAVGYINRHFSYWVWLDQELKKSMGY